MKKVAIVGSGQAGLQLGMNLLDQGGYEVTLLSDRTGKEIAAGPMQATAIMFGDKRQHERGMGLEHWEDQGHKTAGLNIEVRDGGGALQISFKAPFQDGLGLAVDYRLKFPVWMDEFEKRGGKLVIQKAEIKDLELLATQNDLVVVAAGKGEISKLFERDPERSPPYSEPMRQMAIAVVDYDWPLPNSVIVMVPEIGEIIFLPLLTPNGKRSTAVILFARPGSPMMEHYSTIKTGADVLRVVSEQVRRFCPEHAGFFKNASLADERSYLHGGVTPQVRKPIGRLPSGALVMGLGDSLTLVDPICGNGLNNAVVMTKIITEQIFANEAAFDENWMNGVFDEFWDYGKDVFVFMRSLLEQPPHLVEALGSASRSVKLASDIINGYTDPEAFAKWMANAETAKAHVEMRMAEIA